MEEDDFRELISLVKDQMASHGLSDLANDSNYLEDFDGDDDTARLPPPQKHLILLLEAFLLRIKLLDVRTIKQSLEVANGVVDGEGPRGAYLELPSSDTLESSRADFLELPDMHFLRAELQKLIGELREPGPRPEF